ncbi:glycosyltransferase [Salinibacterium sp. SWN167]|uniref:glycosyltransferase n=1 Tax=Salinibacterium sp. SWN167 TaxID=2792054 RepID=UPI0018CEAEB5|nr:glycosyltransferase [Salinibacterium sp. SWN167]MBH0082834.1 glycosyltransferase [Salinibacterium sp. SWN167]
MRLSTPVTATVQSVVFPAGDIDELAPLYVDVEDSGKVAVLDRRTIRLDAGTSVSFATYFNAFPASYWQRWTSVREIILRVSTKGRGVVTVMRSDENGTQRPMQVTAVAGATESTFSLPLVGFDDGGWYWFDVKAEGDIEVTESRWGVAEDPVTTGLVSLGITTFNKPDYCVATLNALADAPEALHEIDRIFMIDQGTRKVTAEAGYDAVAAALGEQLAVIEQSNLGGSGGFSRGMAETLKRDSSDFVMLLDDDVEIEPESVLRAVWFARYCVSPAIVGGHMLDLGKRTVLHAYSEVVDERPFMWGPPDRAHERHDFAESSLRETSWLHRREDSDFNGWWMCLIPVAVIRDIGLALPVFIKWDDAEYGLRAGEAGYPTVSLPGVALWHVSWVDKDDTIDWQAYFHARNRLIAALLHSSFRRGGSLLSEYRKQDLKHLLSLQYYPVALRLQAMRDVLAGPEHLHEMMPNRLAELRAWAADYPEMAVYDAAAAPKSLEGRLSYPPTDGKGPRGAALALFTVRAALRHWFARTPQALVEQPKERLSKRDATWWRLPGFDSVLVDTADSQGSSWYRRDRTRFRSLMAESIRLNRQIGQNWDELRNRYRQQASDITSPEVWKQTFRK